MKYELTRKVWRFKKTGKYLTGNLLTILTFSLLGLSIIACLSSCASKMAFTNSPVVPAAEGSVKIKQDKNNNYKIELKVMRLAEPQRLTPSRKMYVVWMITDHDGTKNIGQLKTSSGFLSKALKSSLTTVSSYKPRDFFITAEDNSDLQYPGAQIVMKTGSF